MAYNRESNRKFQMPTTRVPRNSNSEIPNPFAEERRSHNWIEPDFSKTWEIQCFERLKPFWSFRTRDPLKAVSARAENP